MTNDKSYLLADYATLTRGDNSLVLPGNDERAKQFDTAKCLLGYSGLTTQVEDSEGYPSVGEITIEVDADKCARLHEMPGGFLDGFDPEAEKVYTYAFGWRDGTSKSLFFGILQSWTRADGDKAIILRCVGYLVACQDIPIPESTFPLNDGLAPIVGQPAWALILFLYYLMDHLSSFSGTLLPAIIFTSRFWSYHQHPECRWDYGTTIYPDQKGTRTYALTDDGTYIYLALNDYIMKFNPAGYNFYAGFDVLGQFSIAGDPLAAGEVWRVEEMLYLDTPPRLRMMVRKHKSYNAGEGPADANYNAHIVEWVL